MKKSLAILCLSLIISYSSDAKESKEVQEIKKSIEDLKQDISYLELSAEALETLHSRLDVQFKGHENTLHQRLSEVLIPLMNWPKMTLSKTPLSWVEHQSTQLVLDSVQAKLIQEPLALLSGRELRLSEVTNMRDELRETLNSLETKQSLLELQVEELRLLEKRSRKDVQRAKKTK